MKQLSEENHPMREASLIELIETLPKSHSARVEYTKLLGRLSHEKNERLEMQKRIDELEKENKEIKEQSIRKFIYQYLMPSELPASAIHLIREQAIKFNLEQLQEQE